MTRIGIIAPAPALRAGLRLLLTTGTIETGGISSAAWTIVGEAASLADFAAGGAEADVLILADGVLDEAVLRQCLAEEGKLSVVVLSGDPAEAEILARIPLFGWGVLPSEVTAEELQAGVWAAASGLVVGTAGVFTAGTEQPGKGVYSLSNTEFPTAVEHLTERESQVLELLAQGLPNKQIAAALGISEHTVKFHVSSIYGKLGATNRTEAVRSGVQRGLVTL